MDFLQFPFEKKIVPLYTGFLLYIQSTLFHLVVSYFKIQNVKFSTARLNIQERSSNGSKYSLVLDGMSTVSIEKKIA